LYRMSDEEAPPPRPESGRRCQEAEAPHEAACTPLQRLVYSVKRGRLRAPLDTKLRARLYSVLSTA
jgi:hypothetical protein